MCDIKISMALQYASVANLFKTKSEAEKAERQFLHSISDIRDKETVTLGEVAEDYFYAAAARVKESTAYTHRTSYHKHIEPYFKNKQVNLITIRDISLWHQKLNDYNINYKNRIHGFLKLILDHAMKLEYIEKNVAQIHGGFKSQRDTVIDDTEFIRYITPTQFDLVAKEIKETNPTYLAFFHLTYWTGARMGELQSLTWEDIDFDTWFLRINKTLSTKTFDGGIKITNTKNRKNRNVIIPEQARQLILSLYEHDKKLDDFSWFMFGGIRHTSGTHIRRKLAEYLENANKNNAVDIPVVTHHEFGRHSHASLLLSLGFTYDEIGLRLGDTAAVIEKTYAHLFPQAQTQIVDRLSKKNIDKLMGDS